MTAWCAAGNEDKHEEEKIDLKKIPTWRQGVRYQVNERRAGACYV